MMQIVEVNYVSVLAAAIASFVIGALWYSPMLFGKMWMKLSNVSDKEMKKAKQKGMTKNFAFQFLASLVMSYILAHFVYYTQASTVFEGMQTGFWIWLGFVATVMLGIVLWEGKPWKLYFIKAGHELVALAVMGAILAVWV